MQTMTHGDNKQCPDVKSGRAQRCPGHQVPGSTPPDDELRRNLCAIAAGWASHQDNENPTWVAQQAVATYFAILRELGED